MAYTPANYTGDGSTTDFAFSFPYIDYEDVKVLLDDVETFAFTVVSESTVRFTVAPANGVDIKIYRDTPIEVAEATFYSGSAIRAVDLNENFNQSRYYGEETRELVANATVGTIPDGSIGTAKLADGAITAAKLADNSVTAAKLADDSVDAAAIQDSAVTAVTIATGAVTNTKIADNAVTNAKLADSAVNTAELASSAVSTDKIAASAVTEAKTGFSALLNYVYLTTPGSGTYTPTSGTKRILVEVWGAGGGGGGVNGIATSGWWAKGGSGGGGGYCSKWIASGLDASYSYTVGAGGSGGAAGQNDGSAGGTSTFSGTGVSLTANGGSGGDGKAAVSGGTLFYGVNGGSASGGDLNIQGGKATGNTNYTRLDADSYSGAGWGFPVTQSVGPQSPNGGSAGSNGINPSEGGTGAKVADIATNYAGGDGAPGLIKITEYFV